MEDKGHKQALKFLVQCHKIAPAITAMQAAVLLVLDKENGLTYEEIADRLSVTKSMISKPTKYMLSSKNGQDVIERRNYKIYLTDRGKRYCRSLMVNTKHFINDHLDKAT